MKDKTLFTDQLGLYGWSNLETVLLAALASELPILLIGKHGSAKSFILERLSEILKLDYRFYNASLINYDDLVGIPIPVENNTRLDYISNKDSIWDAEIVFIDEINRTKVDLQNKLFPIINEKRVQGINLTKLKYRWAAMNPPYSDNEDDEDEEEGIYLGTTSLDPALADRFPFIIDVPTWLDLSNENRELILKDKFEGKHELDINLNEIIAEIREIVFNLKSNKDEKINNYIITLMDLLIKKYGYISTRRATMFLETYLYLYASSIVRAKHLNEKDQPLSDIVCTHILNTFPILALKKVDKLDLINIALEALKISNFKDTKNKELLLASDPIEKTKYLLKNINELDHDTINDIIPSIISNLSLHKRKVVSLALYLKLRKFKFIKAAIMETIVNEIKDLFESKKINEFVKLSSKKYSDTIDVLINTTESKYKEYIANILRSFLPDNYSDVSEIKSLYNFSKDFFKEVNI